MIITKAKSKFYMGRGEADKESRALQSELVQSQKPCLPFDFGY